MSTNEVYLKYPALAPMGYAYHPCGMHFIFGISTSSVDADGNEHLRQYERITGKFGRLSEDEAAQELVAAIADRASRPGASGRKFREALEEAMKWNSSGIFYRNDVRDAALAALSSNKE